VLLAAGAAAGMSATFGAPVSAVLLAVELLLFELRPRSIIPVALASATAAGVRVVLEGTHPVFAMPDLATPTGAAMASYIAIGAAIGVASVGVTKAVYAIEDLFDRLPIHWMWWPAIGGLAVGVAGAVAPRTLGVGYSNITDILSNHLSLKVVAFLCAMKFISWSISLGSGTSGGTLAPLFTLGSGLGALLGAGLALLAPSAGIDIRIAALVGMAGMFAGASRALLASVVFSFETTLQPLGLLPLLGGCSAAFLVSCLLMRHSIMTEKIARRGVRVPVEYAADFLDQVLAGSAASRACVTLRAGDTLDRVRAWIASGAPGTSHQGFPVLDEGGRLVGVLTRRDLLEPSKDGALLVEQLIHKPPVAVYEDSTLREAADQMVTHGIGRVPVLSRGDGGRVVGVLTRSDLLSAHKRRLSEGALAQKSIQMRASP
jgi:chloride channel protein, CIC family